MLAQPTIIQARPISVGSNPVHCFCPQCHQQIITRVDYVCLNQIEKKKIYSFLLFRILVHLHGLCVYCLRL